MSDTDLLATLLPVVLILGFGVVAAILSRELRLSPIVGYLVLGAGLNAAGVAHGYPGVDLLAELGVVFLLFDIGLHFSFTHIREQAADIFGFGPVQVLLSTIGLGAIAWAAGLSLPAALLLGATLGLSSTAVVAGLLAERHQQSCPVGLTATAILVFQDVAAILLLIVATALGDGSAVLPAIGLALLKAALAFGAALLGARFVVRPAFDLVARTRNEEVFTATALLVALAAAWATGSVGLSLSLGAFLGGTMLAETPYRPIIAAEIKPFRGLLLGFFFISVGLSLDLAALARLWAWVLGGTALLFLLKGALNAAASLVFRWSVPGSVQLGLLLAQGSEFAFVLLSLPAIRALLGTEVTAVTVAAVALSLALTPSVAEAGRTLAGSLRRRRASPQAELQPRDLVGPVLIVGMGPRGRTIADGLTEFAIAYTAVEHDPALLRRAVADGYNAVFGDLTDPRLWEPVMVGGRRYVALTTPVLDVSIELFPVSLARYPDVARLAVLDLGTDPAPFRAIGIRTVADLGNPAGLDAALLLLSELGIDPGAITLWADRQRARSSTATPGEALVVA